MKSNYQLVLDSTTRLLSREEEKGLFIRLATAKRIAKKLGKKRKRTSHEKSQLGAARKQILIIRERIVTANLPIVAKLAKGHRCPGITAEEFLEEGLFRMYECIDRFDLERGFKFSTYLTQSLVGSYKKMIYSRLREDSRTVSQDYYDDDHRYLGTATDKNSSELIDLSEALRTNRANLNEKEMFFLYHYYGLGDKDPKTIQEIHVMIGRSLSGGRIQQIIARAVSKLGSVLVGGDDEAERTTI